MSDKRANNALFKIELEEGESVTRRLNAIVSSYKSQSRADVSKYPPLRLVEISQRFEDIELTLYLRRRSCSGFGPLVRPYLVNDGDRKQFQYVTVDACLFLATANSLFAVTSGSGYRIVEDFVDYSFPFDTAKKLVANNFTEAGARSLVGTTASQSEIYRRGRSIESSESFGLVWKRLVGRLDSGLLPEGSYLKKLIDPNRPPAIEIKSSIALKKTLDLHQLVSVARELDSLPEPTEEQLRELSFLDNLSRVRNKPLKEDLERQLVENIRQAVVTDTDLDLDVCDPFDASRYHAGADFKLSRWHLGDLAPGARDITDALRQHLADYVDDACRFSEKLGSVYLSYSVNPDDGTNSVRYKLSKFFHGQVNYAGVTYFLLDGTWYQVPGTFLTTLKKNFIKEVFSGAQKILIDTNPTFLEWQDGDERAFNERQAKEAAWYFGDEIFAKSNRGSVELFDLLRVDEPNGRLYIIHAKDGFNAKMRDACSQICISAEVLRQDGATGWSTLSSYYEDWNKNSINATKNISKDTFIGWFVNLEKIYVVLASTPDEFTARTFETNQLHSHIARREILATRNELKGHGDVFRLAHTKRSKAEPSPAA